MEDSLTRSAQRGAVGEHSAVADMVSLLAHRRDHVVRRTVGRAGRGSFVHRVLSPISRTVQTERALC